MTRAVRHSIFAALIGLGIAAAAAGAGTPTPEPAELAATPMPATPESAATPMAVTAEIAITAFTFDPSRLEVAAGSTVRWTNRDGAPHTVTASDRRFDSGRLTRGGTFRYTFAEPGAYLITCFYHQNMTGIVIVQE